MIWEKSVFTDIVCKAHHQPCFVWHIAVILCSAVIIECCWKCLLRMCNFAYCMRESTVRTAPCGQRAGEHQVSKANIDFCIFIIPNLWASVESFFLSSSFPSQNHQIEANAEYSTLFVFFFCSSQMSASIRMQFRLVRSPWNRINLSVSEKRWPIRLKWSSSIWTIAVIQFVVQSVPIRPSWIRLVRWSHWKVSANNRTTSTEY